jgi:predicted amidophosphoribosyltransferase
MKPICELCYTEAPIKDGKVTENWDLVFQSFICPNCQKKAEAEGKPLAHCVGGCYANGKPDPRLKEDYARFKV